MIPQSPVEKLIDDVKEMGENALWFTAGLVDFTTAEGLQIAKNLLGMGSLQMQALQTGVDQLFLDTGLMGLMDQLIDRGKKYEPPMVEQIVNQRDFVNIPIVPILVKAKDAGGLPLTYKDNGTLPDGLTLNTTTTPVQIEGKPKLSAKYTSPHVVRITVTNSFGMDTTVTFMWHIDIKAPVITPIPDQPTTATPPLAVTAVDEGGFLPLTYAANGLAALGLTIDASGSINGTLTTVTGAYPVEVIVTNTQGVKAMETFTWNV